MILYSSHASASRLLHVWYTLYGDFSTDFPKPRYHVGDTVRILRHRTTFGRGFETNFCDEIFKVKKVFRGDPNTYILEEAEEPGGKEAARSTSRPKVEGEEIIGRFYDDELSAINKKDRVFRIEKVLERRKGKALVKW